MDDRIKGLLADITIRIPRSRIVMVVNDYYLVDQNNNRTPVSLDDIEMLISDGYLEKNSIGGVFPTSKAIDDSDNFYVKKHIEGLHGKQVEVAEFPHRYF